MSVSRLSVEDAALVEAIALRVVELLDERQAPALSPQLLTAAQLAAALGVARSFVYEHADELGATRLGAGSKARLRFDLETARSAMDRYADKRSQGEKPSADGRADELGVRRRRRVPSGVPKPGSVLAIRAPRERA